MQLARTHGLNLEPVRELFRVAFRISQVHNDIAKLQSRHCAPLFISWDPAAVLYQSFTIVFLCPSSLVLNSFDVSLMVHPFKRVLKAVGGLVSQLAAPRLTIPGKYP